MNCMVLHLSILGKSMKFVERNAKGGGTLSLFCVLSVRGLGSDFFNSSLWDQIALHQTSALTTPS